MNPVSNIVEISKLYIYYIQLNFIVSFTLFFFEKNIIYYITKEANGEPGKNINIYYERTGEKNEKSF